MINFNLKILFFLYFHEHKNIKINNFIYISKGVNFRVLQFCMQSFEPSCTTFKI